MDAACITHEAISFEQDAFPRIKEPVWILGKQYITDKGKDIFIPPNDKLKTYDDARISEHCRKINYSSSLLSMYRGNNVVVTFYFVAKMLVKSCK